MKVAFVVPGQPRGKGRPKFRRVGKFTQTYTPKLTREYEALVRNCYLEQVGLTKLKGAIRAEITAYFQIPKSASMKKQKMMERGDIPCTIQADIDNVIKALSDGAQGYAFENDRQIVSVTASKRYSHEPRVEVILEELEYDDG